jgi:3-methyladenine DNA glycosylase AlkD
MDFLTVYKKKVGKSTVFLVENRRMRKMNNYTEKLITAFQANKNEENIGPMKAYMRNQFEFLGLRTPERRKLFRAFLKENGKPSIEELLEIVPELWEQPEREFQYVAMELVEKQAKHLSTSHLPLIEKMIVEKSWWDTVDLIASHLVGGIFKEPSNEKNKYLEKWIHSENMWLNRTAILYQLSYKKNTDANQLFSIILLHKESKEFFIQKAIGWALREYSKTAPEEVKNFIENEELAALSKREGMKHINKLEKDEGKS